MGDGPGEGAVEPPPLQTDPYSGADAVDDSAHDDHGSMLAPEPRARLAASSLLRFCSRIPATSTPEDILEEVLEHQWSAFNVPLIWAAAGDQEGHPILTWLCALVDVTAGAYQISGEAITGARLQQAWLDLRHSMWTLGILDRTQFLAWLHFNQYADVD